MAVQEGLRGSQGELICFTNYARTSPNDLVLLLLYAVANPDSVIKANRKVRLSVLRRLGSLIYNIQCRQLFSLPFWDINGTPKIFPRKFDQLLKLTRNDDLIDLEFNIVCKENSYPLIEIPILSTTRFGGKSTTGYKSAVKMYWGAYQMWKHRRNGRN